MNTTQNPKAVVEVQMHEGNEACPVCQETLGLKNVVTTECGHKFHYSCLFTWNNEKRSCPLCRTDFDLGISQNYNEALRDPPESFSDLHRNVISSGFNMQCDDCGYNVEYCAGECGKLFCRCVNRPNSLNVQAKNPIQYSNENELPTCKNCFDNRYEIVLDFLDQQLTNTILDHDDIYELDQMYEYWLMYFNNTSGEALQHTFFNDVEDFKDHMKEIHRQHLRENSNFEPPHHVYFNGNEYLLVYVNHEQSDLVNEQGHVVGNRIQLPDYTYRIELHGEEYNTDLDEPEEIY